MAILQRMLLKLTSLTGNESLRADNVPHAIPRKQHRTSQLFFCIPRHITAHHRQTHTESQALEITQPNRYKSAPFVA